MLDLVLSPGDLILTLILAKIFKSKSQAGILSLNNADLCFCENWKGRVMNGLNTLPKAPLPTTRSNLKCSSLTAVVKRSQQFGVVSCGIFIRLFMRRFCHVLQTRSKVTDVQRAPMQH